MVFLLLVSCGTTRVTVNIDALSFTSEDDRTVTYGEDPVIPPVGPAVTVRTAVFVIPIAGELENVTEIDKVEVALDLLMTNRTGSADTALRVYIAGEEEEPFQTPPFLSGDLSLVPDTTYTAHFLGEGDERILNLFSGNEVRIAAEMEFDVYGDEDLAGVAEISRFDIVVSGMGSVGSG